MGYKNENFNSVVALSARTCSESHVCYCRDCTQGLGGGGGGLLFFFFFFRVPVSFGR